MTGSPLAPRRGRRRVVIVATVAVAALAVTIGAVWILSPRGPVVIASPVDPGPLYSGSVTTTTGVCGFDGPLVEKLVATRPAGASAPAPAGWALPQGSDAGYIAATDQEVIVGTRADSVTEFLRYGQDGSLHATTRLGIDVGGAWTAASDGTLFVLDGSSGSRTLRRVDGGGELTTLATADGAGAPDGSGSPRPLQWIADYKGAPALLVASGEGAVQAFRVDGSTLGTVDGVDGDLVGTFGDHTVFTAASRGTTLVLQAVDLASATTTLHSVVTTSPATATDTSRTPSPPQLTSVVTGPGGDGFVMSSRASIQWTDAIGIRKGVIVDGQDGLSLASSSPAMSEHDDRYWLLADGGDAGSARVVTMTSDELKTRMNSPLLLTASAEPEVAQLGLGLGAVTHAAFNHFDAGVAPRVFLRAEQGWGELDGVDRSSYEVRYTVQGDPALADPVAQPQLAARLPWGGGETALSLPAARPGAYQIDLSLVDPRDGSVRSGACMRYSIGAVGADLTLGDLSPGDQWGGPDPLRSVELADRLGIGSARVQLDFGALVPSPGSAPDAGAVDWSKLPGSIDGDPFGQLRAAAAYAESHGITLIIQVGAGGDAETTAARAGTWAGWSETLIAGIIREAPQISAWEAFNEPNNAGLEASDYWKSIEIPFADAAHRAQPNATVIAGNTLGFADDWWKTAEASGVCDHVDAVGVHPYTGWNRSWEEDGLERPDSGYAALRAALGSRCAQLPVWDTESGWTADSATGYWAQGSNVTRKLLWNRQEGVAGWTYFFSEGGWGENDLSWSLIQYRAYVKPGALAFATTSRLLAGRGTPVSEETDLPFTHVMSIPGDDTLMVAWTDEARLDARLSTDAASVEVTDEYGASHTLEVADGVGATTLTATPQFFRVPAGSTLRIDSDEAYGQDLLAGAPVSATSTHSDTDAAVITSGTADPYRPWRSGDTPGDDPPSVTVTLNTPAAIDRIGVATGNITCCEAGMRSYTVDVQTADGTWQTVAQPKDQFWDRTVVFSFPPVQATAVRVTAEWTTIRGVRMLDANYTSFSGGLPPPFMGLQPTTSYVMSVAAISAWAPAAR